MLTADIHQSDERKESNEAHLFFAAHNDMVLEWFCIIARSQIVCNTCGCLFLSLVIHGLHMEAMRRLGKGIIQQRASFPACEAKQQARCAEAPVVQSSSPGSHLATGVPDSGEGD